MKILKFSIVIILLFSIMGCRSTKTLTSNAEIDKSLTAKQIIRETTKQEARFKTMQAKVRFEYTEGDKSLSHTVSLRMEKDKTIWLNAGVAGISMARVMITPDNVKFYDKINNQYFDGDFALLTDLLGTEVDFDMVQNIFLGEPIFNLKDNTYITQPHESSYVLRPKEQRRLFEIFFLINPGFFKIDSQQLYQPSENRMLQIDYSKYQQVSNQIFPENIRIIALENNNEVTIDLDFKAITLNGEVRFPFSIPSGFTEIEIK